MAESYFCGSIAEADEEDIFLKETLEWKEGLKEEQDRTSDAYTHDVTKLAKYLFLAEEMGWRKGLPVFGEKEEEAVEKEL